MNLFQAFRRMICTILCITLLIPLFPASAAALSKGTVYVSDMTAKVYASKSTSSKKIATVSFGQKISCTSVSGKWAKVKNSSGKTGYMQKSALTEKNPNTYKKTIYIQKNGLKVYANASTSSKVIGKLKRGSGYSAVAKSASGRWLRIKNGKYYGYVQAVFTDTSPYKKGTKVYMTESSIAVADAPGYSYTVGTLSLGQSCFLLEKNSKYAKVRSSGGHIGYVNDPSVLSTKNPNTLSKTMYVQADNAPLYPHGITINKSRSVDKNTAVTALACHTAGNMEWYRVKYKNKYYYIPGILLADSKVPSGGRTVYAYMRKFAEGQEETIPIYEKPSWSSKQVAKVLKDTKLTLVSCKGQGVRVRTPGGKLGYVMPTALSKKP